MYIYCLNKLSRFFKITIAMKHKLILTLLLSLLMTSTVIGQVKLSENISPRKTYVTSLDIDKVYHKETGHKIPKSDFNKIVKDNPGVFLEKQTDDEGNLQRYLYDPNNQINGGMNLLKSYISDSIAFPNFRVSTIDGEKIELKDLIGKLVILRFESGTLGVQLNMPWIEELDEKINALNNKEAVEAIIIIDSAEEEAEKQINLSNSNFKLVADGLKIKEKYFIRQTPTTLLIGINGQLIGVYRNSDEIVLEEHLNK